MGKHATANATANGTGKRVSYSERNNSVCYPPHCYRVKSRFWLAAKARRNPTDFDWALAASVA